MHHQGHEASHDHHPPHGDDHHHPYQGINIVVTIQYKPCDDQVKLPESYSEFGRSDERNDNNTNHVEADGVVITDNEEGTHEAGRKQFIIELQSINNG